MSTHDTAADGAASTNGTSPAAGDVLTGIVAELEDLLAPITAEKQQLEARLKDLDAQAVRIREGISALTGPGVRAVPSPPKKGRSSHDWVPSEKTLDDIYAALVQADEPMTVTQISDAARTSRGTVSKGIEELRKRERVRFAGNGGRGNAGRFAPMEP